MSNLNQNHEHPHSYPLGSVAANAQNDPLQFPASPSLLGVELSIFDPLEQRYLDDFLNAFSLASSTNPAATANTQQQLHLASFHAPPLSVPQPAAISPNMMLNLSAHFRPSPPYPPPSMSPMSVEQAAHVLTSQDFFAQGYHAHQSHSPSVEPQKPTYTSPQIQAITSAVSLPIGQVVTQIVPISTLQITSQKSTSPIQNATTPIQPIPPTSNFVKGELLINSNNPSESKQTSTANPTTALAPEVSKVDLTPSDQPAPPSLKNRPRGRPPKRALNDFSNSANGVDSQPHSTEVDGESHEKTEKRRKSSISGSAGRRRGGKDLLTEEEKRANHIASEQKRRNMIRTGFAQLVELVPGLKTQGGAMDAGGDDGGSGSAAGVSGSSKSEILQKTVEFVRYLGASNQVMMERVAVLQKRWEAVQMQQQRAG
ncbi:hypothetical protein BJ742DRAFT_819463 [Cladochytrium replicatum]|nr:hypothetical protein BJ742DRAFT_819463 [Cladochytrium replicatum]